MDILEEVRSIVDSPLFSSKEELLGRLEDLSGFLFIEQSDFLRFCAEHDYGAKIDFEDVWEKYFEVIAELKRRGLLEDASPIINALRERLGGIPEENAFFSDYIARLKEIDGPSF